MTAFVQTDPERGHVSQGLVSSASLGSLSPEQINGFGLHHPQLVLGEAEKDFAQDEVGALAAHAAVVYHQLYELKKNAREVCIALKQCKDAYVAAAREKDPSRKYVGWNSFCKNNFSSLGLSERNIRAAVKTGEVLLTLKSQNPQTYEAIADLSRDALFVIGSTPGVADEVGGILSRDPEAKLTAAQLREMAVLLQSAEQANQELAAQLEHAKNAKTRAEACAATLNGQVQEFEGEIERLTHAMEQQQANAGTVSIDEEQLQAVRLETRKKNQELAKTQRTLSQASQELSKVQSHLYQQRESQEVIADLAVHMNAMLSKFTPALVQKIRGINPSTQVKFNEVAEQLRVLASQIEVAQS